MNDFKFTEEFLVAMDELLNFFYANEFYQALFYLFVIGLALLIIFLIIYNILDITVWNNLCEFRRRNAFEDFLDEHPELCPDVYDGKNMACKYCPHGNECKKDCRKQKQQKE